MKIQLSSNILSGRLGKMAGLFIGDVRGVETLVKVRRNRFADDVVSAVFAHDTTDEESTSLGTVL